MAKSKMEKDEYSKTLNKKMRAIRFAAAAQTIFVLAIVASAISATWTGLYNDAEKTAENAASRTSDILDGYKSSFKGLLIPIKDKIAEDPSFEEMQAWLQSKEDEFGAAVGEEAYDGIAFTYKDGYAHSWNYGEYDDYDAHTRPWYQAAQKANGEIAVVAPYVTYLSSANQEVETDILMTIAQKYNDEISFDLDLKLPKVKDILKGITTMYPHEKIFIYNEDGQILSSTVDAEFAHNVYEQDIVIDKSIVKMVSTNAQKKGVLQVDWIGGRLQYLYFSTDGNGNTIAIMVPASEIFWHDYFITGLICLALIGYVIYVFVRSKRTAIEYVERDRRLALVENSVQKERLYVDVNRMRFYGNTKAGKNAKDESYDALYALICSCLVDKADFPRMEMFLSPSVIRKCPQTPYHIDKERFLMRMQNKEGEQEEKTIEMRRLAFVQEQKPIVEIAMLDAAESVDLLKKSLEETRRLKQEKEDEYNRFMGYICMAEDGVEEVDFANHKITRFSVKGNSLQREISPYPFIPAELFHEDDREQAMELYSLDRIKAMCRRQDVTYAELRMKWGSTDEYRWCNIITLGLPVTKKTPCTVLVLIKDINELKVKETEQRHALEDAFKLAEQGSEAKGSFLSKMSHEIRTPLNAIIGYLSIAKDSGEDLDKIRHCIDNGEIASRHLLQIINDVLDMSSIESGKMKIANEEFDLKREIADITTIFYQNAKAKKVDFETHVENVTEEWVMGDQLRLNQVLMNLLSNAVKFTPEGGLVQLKVEQMRKDDRCVYMKFSVTDNGIGMSPEYMSRMFHPFEQENAGTARKYGGSGLGLSITNNLVQMMGGKIDVQSKQNEGTTFDVTIFFGLAQNEHIAVAHADYSHVRVLVVDDKPDEGSYIKAMLKRCGAKADSVAGGELALKRLEARKGTDDNYDLCIIDWKMPGMDGCEVTRAIRRELGDKLPIIIATAYDVSEFQEEAKEAGANKIISKPLFQSTLFDVLVNNFGTYTPKPKDAKEKIDLKGVRVLLAEDNAMNREIAVTMLEKAGVKVDQANDGLEAVTQFLTSAPGTYTLILMDVQMPVMDGYEATKQIRGSDHAEAKSIPIIAMTANAFAEDVAEALSKGMDAHIAKPINYDKLFTLLRKYAGL